jgi:hypothetical protein
MISPRKQSYYSTFGGNEKKDFEHKGEFEQLMRAKIGN